MGNHSTDQNTGWDPELYDSSFGFVSQYGIDVVDLLDPAPDERILDLGCGTGELTRTIDRKAKSVVGVDTARPMVERARANAPTCSFCHADAHHLPFTESFDAVFSNATLHWLTDSGRVCEQVESVLADDGRFVGELGGAGNIRGIRRATRRALERRGYEYTHPWRFPTIGEFAPLVEAAGLELTGVWLIDRPTVLAGGADGLFDWFDMFGDELFETVPADRRPAVIDDVESRLRPTQFDDGVWTVQYRRLRFIATRQDRAQQ